MTSTGDKKTYVLDTSVLLSSPRAMFTFAEHEVVLPVVVIKELEAKRNDPEVGGPARAAIRLLDELLRDQPEAVTNGGVFRVGTEGGTLRVELNHTGQDGLPDALRRDHSNDTRILAVAKNLSNEGRNVVLISKDMPMRFVAATVLQLQAEEYRRELATSDNYTGLVTLDTEKSVIDELYKDKCVEVGPSDVPVNCGLVLRHGHSASALARFKDDGRIHLVPKDQDAFGVRGRSAEQKIALAHLLDPDIGIVSLGGRAGTGKSVLALAAALEAVLERRTQKKIVVFRPLYAVGGQDLGYLPGSESEKMGPWGAAVFDALQSFAEPAVISEVIERNLVEVLPLTHIRGRTFTDIIIIIDEAQQLERPVLLTALSRVGLGSRVFLTHDVAQRDNLRVGRHDGVAAVVEKLKGEPLFAHIELTRSERSPVAALVTGMLDEMEL